jgi:hypothetical protein
MDQYLHPFLARHLAEERIRTYLRERQGDRMAAQVARSSWDGFRRWAGLVLVRVGTALVGPEAPSRVRAPLTLNGGGSPT